MVPHALSNSKARQLSDRLRNADTPDPSDMDLLGELLIEFNSALGQVAGGLRGLGLSPTTRLKTSGTIIEKMKREAHLDLTNIRDLAGARIVQRMSLEEQDEIAAKIVDLWPGTRLIDRRLNPSHGYRAIHLVARIDGCPVEIQLRTLYQDTWAQVMESLGDSWGRAVRYGGEPDDPKVTVYDGSSVTRSELVHSWIGFSDSLYELAKAESTLARLQDLPSKSPDLENEVRDLEMRFERVFGPIRDSVREIAADFAKARAAVSEGRVEQ